METGPGYLRIAYEAEPVDLRHAAGRSWLVGLPLEGEVSLEVVEARASSPAEPASLPSLPEDLEGPAFLGCAGIRPRPARRRAGLRTPARGGWFGAGLRPRGCGPALCGRGEVTGGRQKGSLGGNVLQPDPGELRAGSGWRRHRGVRRERPSCRAVLPNASGVVLREGGIYRITGADLESAGIDLAAVDPSRIRMLYGGGRVLPLSISQAADPVLEEQAIVVEDGGDGRLGPEDSILFHGEPVSRWEYSEGDGAYAFRKNPYTHDNVYWLEFHGEVAGRRAARRSGALQAAGAPEAAELPRARARRVGGNHPHPDLFRAFRIRVVLGGFPGECPQLFDRGPGCGCRSGGHPGALLRVDQQGAPVHLQMERGGAG